MRINFVWGGIATWLVSQIVGIEANIGLARGDDTFSKPVNRPRPDIFSNKDFVGGYAFQITGNANFYATNEYNVATGVMIADGKGGLSGHGTFRDGTYLNGWISCDVTISGGYSINTKGLGVIGATGSTSTPGCSTRPFDFNIVLSNNGALAFIASNAYDCMSGTLYQQSSAEFSLADFNGDYGLMLQGPSSIALANEPQTVGVGILTAYGNGTVTGNFTFTSAGYTCPGNFQDGVYAVDSDGTGGIYMNWFPLTFGVGCFPSVVDVDLVLQNDNTGYLANKENDQMTGTVSRMVFK